MIVFGEHQSTVNENMPLRSLLYIGRAYERLVPPRSRYKKKIVSLPTPEFYTFYNGKEKWEKEKELRLSDAYIVKDGEPSLKLKVKVINIRPEEHHEILERCQVLKEYSQFMETVQNYQISGEEEPYKKAIKECIEKGILADYLMRKGSEVVNMLLDEYDYETDIEVQREEAREEGRKQGREEGQKKGREEGRIEEKSALIRKKLEKGNRYDLVIPNREIRNIITEHILKLFKENIKQDGQKVNAFCDALLTEKADVAEKLFSDYMQKTISVRDTFVQKPTKENFYHGILLGILGFKENWLVTSNRESGDGFSDIMIQVGDSEVGIVIEVKYANDGNLEAECKKALKQIDDTGYAEALHQDGICKILKYAIACYKKTCKIMLEAEKC